jgi:hypothetical protein
MLAQKLGQEPDIYQVVISDQNGFFSQDWPGGI